VSTHNLPEDPKESLLHFPCSFAIKAMGRASDDFDALVVGLIRPFVDDILEGAIQIRPSKAGNFTAVTVTFTATSREQLDDIYRAVSGHPDVLMTL
jgi:hypothetical protein